MQDFALMGILNVTPDSFSDGGQWLDPAAAVAHAERMVAEGATVVDVGGESTRPGAQPVPAEEELRRVIPVVEDLATRLPAAVTISIDTAKAVVAAEAIAAGATYVNDVTAFTGDPEMLSVVAGAPPRVRCCLMQMRGEPRTMQHEPRYDDVFAEVETYLRRRLDEVASAGVDPARVDLDPGIGFGKTAAHNLRLIRELGRLAAIGRPLVLGTSRKTTLAQITGRAPSELVAASVATSVLGYERGVRTFRVHDVAEHRDALMVARAVLEA